MHITEEAKITKVLEYVLHFYHTTIRYTQNSNTPHYQHPFPLPTHSLIALSSPLLHPALTHSSIATLITSSSPSSIPGLSHPLSPQNLPNRLLFASVCFSSLATPSLTMIPTCCRRFCSVVEAEEEEEGEKQEAVASVDQVGDDGAHDEGACQRPSTGKGYPKECSDGVRWW